MIYDPACGVIVALAVALAGCDGANGERQATRVDLRCGSVEPSVVPPSCEPSRPTIEPDSTITLSPQLEDVGTDGLWIRDVRALLPLPEERVLAVGTWGDFFAQGSWWIVLDSEANTVATGGVEQDTDFAFDAIVSGDHVWLMLSSFSVTHLVRIDAEGEAASFVVDGVAGTRLAGLDEGGVVLHEYEAEAIRGFDGEGVLQWESPADQSPGGHLVGGSTIRLVDADQSPVWEHDPLLVVPPGFEGYGAIEPMWASDGGVVALGREVGDAGDEAVAVRLAADGAQRWALRRPRTQLHGAATHGDSTVVFGEADECSTRSVFLTVDAEGTVEREGIVGHSTQAWWIDADGIVWSAATQGTDVELLRFAGGAA